MTVNDRLLRGLGVASVVGAVLAAVASVPSRWYGLRETDAYIFDPATFSPLWIERTLVPVASLVAIGLLACGLAGLLLRDRSVAGRLRRWGTGAAAVGLLLFEVPVLAFALTRNATSASGALVVLVAFLVGLVSVAVLLVGLLSSGVGYARTDRPLVGYALAGGTVVTAVLTGVSTTIDLSGFGGFLLMIAPLLGPFAVVGHELWTHPEPVPDAGADEASGTERGGGGRGGQGANERAGGGREGETGGA